ncbi:hypothetical protein [Microcoleus sp. D2_18a_D3]
MSIFNRATSFWAIGPQANQPPSTAFWVKCPSHADLGRSLW